jgi:hypothetical protein
MTTRDRGCCCELEAPVGNGFTWRRYRGSAYALNSAFSLSRPVPKEYNELKARKPLLLQPPIEWAP